MLRIYKGGTSYLLLPNLVFFAAFVWLPILFSIGLSFFSYGLGEMQFIGFDNFFELYNDARVWNAFWNTLRYAVLMIPSCIFLGLMVAILLNQPFIKGKSFFRLVALIPYIVPLATISLVWMWIFEPNWDL